MLTWSARRITHEFVPGRPHHAKQVAPYRGRRTTEQAAGPHLGPGGNDQFDKFHKSIAKNDSGVTMRMKKWESRTPQYAMLTSFQVAII